MKSLLLAIFVFITAAAVHADVSPSEMPERKAGLWESKLSSPVLGKTMVSNECVDAENDQKMMARSMNNSASRFGCDTNYKKRDNSFIVDISCKRDGMKMNSSTVFTGDFQSSYNGEITMQISLPQSPVEAPPTKMQIAANYIGECPSDMKPGDIVTGDGQRMNINDL